MSQPTGTTTDHTGTRSGATRTGATGTGATGTGATGTGTGTQSQREVGPVAGRIARLAEFLGVQLPGWGLLAVVVVCAVVGSLLAWHELLIAAVAGAVVLGVAALFTIGRQTYRVTLQMQRHQVTVGERALGELVVVNTSDRRLLPARIELPVGRRLASFGLPSLAGRASHDEVFAVPTSRRSVIAIGPARTVRGDPFGLMGREIRWTGSIELYVHPKTIAIPGRTGGFIRDLEGYTTAQLTNSDVSFHALRDYVAGDDRRYVHWKSTARTGTLMVRQFEETRRSQVALGLDVDPTSYRDADEFELAISVLGSLAVQAIRDDQQLSVLTSAGPLAAPTARRVLDQLCTVEAGGQGGIAPLARIVRHGDPNASLVALVTGGVATGELLRFAGATFSADVRVLMIGVDLGAELSVQTVDNVTVARFGALDQLPRAVRRAST